MSDRQEQLSALLDDYSGSDQDRAALSELQADVNQQYTLQRYGLIGDAMRNELPEQIMPDFAAGIRSAISSEQPIAATPRPVDAEQRGSSWLTSLFKPVAGLAVAASVALVAVALVQVQKPGADSQNQLTANADLQTQAKVQQLARTPVVNNAVRVSGTPSLARQDNLGTKWKIKRGKPEVQSKLNTYLINHNEYSSSMNGIIPQARVVGFDAQR